jgi:hypothetical protein
MKEHNREVRGRAEQKQIPLLPSLALRAAVGMTNFVGQRLDAAVAQPECRGPSTAEVVTGKSRRLQPLPRN